jgi:hypothetical protein
MGISRASATEKPVLPRGNGRAPSAARSFAAIRFAYDTGLLYSTGDAGPTARKALEASLAASGFGADADAAQRAAAQGGPGLFVSQAFDPSAPAGPPDGGDVPHGLNGDDSALDAPGRRLHIIGSGARLHTQTRARERRGYLGKGSA